MTTAISLSDAQAMLSKLIELQKNDAVGVGSVSEGDTTITFESGDELLKHISYLTSLVNQLQQRAVGAPTFGRSAAVFTRCS